MLAEKLSAWKFPLLLVFLTIALLAVIELRHPYYFLQDDNRVYFLPYFVHNLNALLGGELPFFNFHQYLGTPVSFLSAPFYPVNYLAMFLSRLFLGHYYGMMEFVAAIHLVIAALGFYRFARQFDLEEMSCVFGALAWTFSAFIMIVGNSWIHVVSYAAYIPWILFFSIRQMQSTFSTRSFLTLAFVRLLAFLVGYPQWFIYTVTFEVLLVAALYVVEKKRGTNEHSQLCTPFFFAVRYVAGYALFLILALPEILQLLHESGDSAARKTALSWNEYVMNAYDMKLWLHGLVTPFLEADVNRFGELHYISHIGYLSILFVLLALTQVRNLRIAIFALLATMSLLWSADIVFTKAFYYLPFFNKLRIPFKLQFFTGFFLAALATLGADIFFSRIKGRGHQVFCWSAGVILFLHLANFALLYGFMPSRMLADYLDTPPFSEPLQKMLTGGRIVSAGPDVVWDGEKAAPEYMVPALGYNFATLWGLYHFGGYEGLLSERNLQATLGLKNSSVYNIAPNTVLNVSTDIPLDHFRKWGVKWYVINSRIPLTGTDGLTLVSRDRYRQVLHDPAGKPFVYWADALKTAAPPFSFRTNSVEIATSRAHEGLLLVNVLYNPFFRGYLDGKEFPVTETEDGQVSVVVPAGGHTVTIAYVDTNFWKGLLVSGALLLGGAAVWVAVKFRKAGKKVVLL